MSYLTHAINDSATLCGEAAGAIAPLTAVKFDGNGKLATAGAGELCIGSQLAVAVELNGELASWLPLALVSCASVLPLPPPTTTARPVIPSTSRSRKLACGLLAATSLLATCWLLMRPARLLRLLLVLRWRLPLKRARPTSPPRC